MSVLALIACLTPSRSTRRPQLRITAEQMIHDNTDTEIGLAVATAEAVLSVFNTRVPPSNVPLVILSRNVRLRCKRNVKRTASTHSTQKAERTRRNGTPTPPAARHSRDRQSPIGACGTEWAGWTGWLWAGGVDRSRRPRPGAG